MTSLSSTNTNAHAERRLLWALLTGNFVIGTGVMLVAGTLTDIAQSVQVSTALAGQLITAGAITVALAAPIIAALMTRVDRRHLLAGAMLWYAALHLACAFSSDYLSLLILRVLALLAAAAFTPQAAAVAGLLAAPERRGQAITTVFLGWALAGVLGAPMAALVGGHWGWRTAFAIVAALSLLSAYFVWISTPAKIKSPAIDAAMWQRVVKSKVMRVTILVTVLSSIGQFVLFAYLSPYVAHVLHGSANDLAALLTAFGLFGLAGSFAISRMIDRIGAAQAVLLTLLLMACSLLLWPLGSTIFWLTLVILPWAIGCFASNSAQQARLVALDPAMASVSIALNTSAIYLGQGIGAALGGWYITHGSLSHLHWGALAGMLSAIAVSAWATKLQSQTNQRSC